MKAIVIHAPKDLRIEERPVPSAGPGEVLIKMAVGGICGSDLHYYQHGGFGTIRLREPMVLGHEVSGHVTELGAGVTSLNVGDLVAVSPSRPCHACKFCHKGALHHCLNMRFYGSAMPFPHIQGAFQQMLVADAAQCVPANGLTAGEAAMAEPLAVCLHAAGKAGDLLGKRVLITGCGPIGLLCVLIARSASAAEIVATDLTRYTLDMALANGADRALDAASETLDEFTADKGHFDVLFECTGVAAALGSAIPAMRPGGVIVQVGLGGDMTVPMQMLTAKELQLRGSFRFHPEFATGVELMRKGLIQVKPLISQTVGLEDAVNGFELAADRTQAMKAQIALS